MPVNWNLKNWLRDGRNVSSASQAKRIVRERTGYVLSTQAVCDLMKREPKMIRLETVQAICDAFYCRLSDFCEVRPLAAKRRPPNPFCPSASKADGGGASRIADSSNTNLGKGQRPKIDFASLFPKAGAAPGPLVTEPSGEAVDTTS